MDEIRRFLLGRTRLGKYALDFEIGGHSGTSNAVHTRVVLSNTAGFGSVYPPAKCECAFASTRPCKVESIETIRPCKGAYWQGRIDRNDTANHANSAAN